MSRKLKSFLATSVIVVGVGLMMAFDQNTEPAHTHGSHTAAADSQQPAPSGKAIARAYIAGMEAADLDGLNALFIGDDKSSILENASDEGSWEHYRDHHLKPEMDVVKGFKFDIVKEAEESHGPVTLVQQTGTFSVEVRGEKLEYRVAVSYVIVLEDKQPRIAHLHWSSRPQKKKTPAQPE